MSEPNRVRGQSAVGKGRSAVVTGEMLVQARGRFAQDNRNMAAAQLGTSESKPGAESVPERDSRDTEDTKD